jgi:xanthine dehydrogenase accessory factor
MNFETFLQDFQRAKESQKSFVVVTMVNSQGSAPQEVGARLIATAEGYFSGTVGGGKLEKAALEKSKELLSSGKTGSHFEEWNLQKDIGMSCGGVVSLFFEIHNLSKVWKIVVFGAGHVSQELIRVLLRLECLITCVDSRPEWLERLPQDSKLEKKLVHPLESYVPQVPKEAFVISATMGHGTDLPILHEILKGESRVYLGCIGSAVKAKKLRQNLRDLGLSAEKSEAFFCPVGEPFGNSTPAEIAISIAAQLLRVRSDLEGSAVDRWPSSHPMPSF